MIGGGCVMPPHPHSDIGSNLGLQQSTNLLQIVLQLNLDIQCTQSYIQEGKKHFWMDIALWSYKWDPMGMDGMGLYLAGHRWGEI